MNPSVTLIATILLSSFLGSWHCAGMCSPIASIMNGKREIFAYHLGRLISYTTLGVLAGQAGSFFLNNSFDIIRWTAALLMALILISSGVSIFQNQRSKKNWFSNQLFLIIKKLQGFHLNHSPIVVGLLTALLPCGWLYTFVTAAIATKSSSAGALTMLLFWVGTLPALSVIPLMVKQLVRAANQRQQKAAGLLLIFAALYSIVSFMATQLDSAGNLMTWFSMYLNKLFL